jgi:hypothetical protein
MYIRAGPHLEVPPSANTKTVIETHATSAERPLRDRLTKYPADGACCRRRRVLQSSIQVGFAPLGFNRGLGRQHRGAGNSTACPLAPTCSRSSTDT